VLSSCPVSNLSKIADFVDIVGLRPRSTEKL